MDVCELFGHHAQAGASLELGIAPRSKKGPGVLPCFKDLYNRVKAGKGNALASFRRAARPIIKSKLGPKELNHLGAKSDKWRGQSGTRVAAKGIGASDAKGTRELREEGTIRSSKFEGQQTIVTFRSSPDGREAIYSCGTV